MLRFMLALLLAGALLSVLLAGWFWQQLQQPLPIDEEMVIELRAGEGLGHIARRLVTEGVLSDHRLLLVFSRLSGRGQQLLAGEYALRPGDSTLDLLARLEAGQVVTYAVTLVEGWTLGEALRALHQQPKLKHLLDSQNQADFWAVLGIEQPLAAAPEGLFSPDTYRFHKGMSDVDVLRLAYRQMMAVLEREWAQRADPLPYESPYEALIMASVVEKETGVPAERGEIAGVFVRRLQRGMRLQTDPTVIYGLGPDFDGNLRRVHLQDPSNRFNTYRHHGLPPTPIALAGRAAIHAALNPLPGDSLYFVARGDGSHIFSRTLAEHQAAVDQYQRRQRKTNYRSSPAPETTD